MLWDLDKVSPGSDQLYSWGGAEGAPRGYPGPSAPPQWWGFGAAKPPQTPTQKCKVRKNLVLDAAKGVIFRSGTFLLLFVVRTFALRAERPHHEQVVRDAPSDTMISIETLPVDLNSRRR